MIKFGTSGFRGIIGDNFTKANIHKIGAAFRKIAERQKAPVNIVVGFDNRFMGYEAAVWFCETACSNTVHATFMTESVPSPFIAYKAVTQDYGIIITASHNPYEYNGIKIFLHGGKEADDEFCSLLSTEIAALKNIDSTKFDELVKSGIIKNSSDTSDYTDKIASLINTKAIKTAASKILFNPMHGSSIGIVNQLFTKLGIKYDSINDTIDPYFGGSLPAPYPYNLTKMADTIVKGKYSFGIALDGDGDRIAVIDGDGKFYDCNYLSAACLYYLTQIRKQKGGAVKNFLTSNLIVKICKHFGYEIHETPVGFKFIGKKMQETDAIVAAESGGMGFKQVSLSKDGIAAAAFLVDLVVTMKKSIGEIIKEISGLVSFPSVFLEFAYPFKQEDREAVLSKILAPVKPEFLSNTVKIDTYSDGYKLVFPNDYWCAARLSGNENVLRMYTEMQNEKACSEVISTMEKFYGITERQK